MAVIKLRKLQRKEESFFNGWSEFLPLWNSGLVITHHFENAKKNMRMAIIMIVWKRNVNTEGLYQDQTLDAYKHARHILPGWNICTSAQFAWFLDGAFRRSHVVKWHWFACKTQKLLPSLNDCMKTLGVSILSFVLHQGHVVDCWVA